LGGYVAGSAKLIDFLRNRAATWIYTTALSAADTAAAITAIKIVKSESSLRQQLWQNVASVKQGLTELGISAIALDSPIIAIKVGDISKTLEVADYLKAHGIFAPAIRPPTVPTARIRITLMATHTPEQIQSLMQCLQFSHHVLANLD
jgi:8-amino-7-oxononanoate synthase